MINKTIITGIYKITSPSGRIYIGQAIDIIKRWESYKYSLKFQPRLNNSFKKYGIENHRFEVIEECVKDILNERERYWQDFYSVLSPKGLNCVLTKIINSPRRIGFLTKNKMKKRTPWKLSEGVRLKMGKSRIGKKHSEEWSKNISKALIGRSLSKEHREKISMRQKNIPNLSLSKSILQYSLDNVFIKEWSSAAEVNRVLGYNRSNIASCCRGEYKTARGFSWRYKL